MTEHDEIHELRVFRLKRKTLVLSGGEWSVLYFAHFNPGKEPLVPIGYDVGWVAELVWTWWQREKFLPFGESNSDPPACSLSLY
jgi:hypothetical protein